MAEKKLVFIDIDGTLFDNERGIIHDSTVDAIKKCRENNVYVCIASGRSSEMATEVIDKYGLTFDGFVVINGQLVILEDEVIYKKIFEKQFIKDFIEECEKYKVPFGLISNKGSLVSSHDPMVVKAFHDFKIELPRISISSDYEDDIYQGLFFDMRYFKHFGERFKDQARFISWMGNDGADIVPKGSSKAVGMEIIREKLGVKKENVIAIGDSTNDIEMIQYANIGIAMGNAKQELKEISDYVTDHIANDGLYKAFKKYNLI